MGEIWEINYYWNWWRGHWESKFLSHRGELSIWTSMEGGKI